ncbi:MAG: recombinase family protein [Planctomycetota bacterium]
MIANKKYRVLGYARTSSEEQKSGLETQKVNITARGFRQMELDDDAEWKGCYCEHESATTVSWEDRPEFQAMFAELEKGDMLIVWRLNRIDRKPWRLHNALDKLDTAGIRVLVMDLSFGKTKDGGEIDLSTALGRSIVTWLGCMYDMFIEGLSQDASAGVQRRIAQGYAMGVAAPPGMRIIRVRLPEGDETRRKVVPKHAPPGEEPGKWMDKAVWDQKQCNIIREAFVRSRVFHEDMPAIAIDFCNRDLKTASGAPWVKAFREKDRPAPTGILIKRGCIRWDRRKLNRAMEMMDDLIKNAILPIELRIDEHVIQKVARQMLDPEALKKLLEDEGTLPKD